MILLTLFGLGMFILGSLMLFKPYAFANGIVTFSNKSRFHLFEISSRGLVGLALILFASYSPYPTILYSLGGLLCFVSVFLIIIGESRHKQFAQLTSNIGGYFRPIGIFAQICGIVLIFIGIY